MSYKLHNLRSRRFFAFGRAVLYSLGVCGFALYERKTANIRSSRTMLPQAKFGCGAGGA
jgi:hypothetical protein